MLNCDPSTEIFRFAGTKARAMSFHAAIFKMTVLSAECVLDGLKNRHVLERAREETFTNVELSDDETYKTSRICLLDKDATKVS